MANAYAYFDCLSICDRLESAVGNADISEIHLFAYLSCLLSIYKQRPVSSWQYSFSVTRTGYPYSPELEEEFRTLVTRGCLDLKKRVVNITSTGRGEYEIMREFSINTERDRLVEAACSTALVMPVGMVRKAISVTPDIRQATELDRSTRLLDETAERDIYSEFEALRAVPGLNTTEIMLPAVVWLTYLCLISESEVDDSD